MNNTTSGFPMIKYRPAALFLLACSLAFSAEIAEGRPLASKWAGSYPYDKATAHVPGFDDKKLWPHLSGKEYFLATKLPPKRVLVWAKPGTDGGAQGVDPLAPASWTDQATGQPASSLPDLETDIVIPAAPMDYTVDFQNPGHGKKEKMLSARCVTVGAKVRLNAADATVRGHVWVQNGGHFMVDVTLYFTGPDHTFYRNDNAAIQPDPMGRDRTYLCQYLNLDKASLDASTEFIGMFHSGDEFQILAGTMIVGADSVMEPGREASPFIEKSGRIAVMVGGYFGKWILDMPCCDIDIRGGTLQGGMPDRPLTRNAIVKIGYKNFTNAKCTLPTNPNDDDKRQDLKREPSIKLTNGASIRSYSTDIAKARLVIAPLPQCYGITFHRPAKGSEEYAESVKDKYNAAYYTWLDVLPIGLDMQIAKGAIIDGVELSGFRKGGLMMADRSERKTWKHVFFGENLAPEAELVGGVHAP